MFNPDTELPPSTDELLAYLDKLYPARCIRVGETEVAAHRYSAKRELIEELLARREREREGQI